MRSGGGLEARLAQGVWALPPPTGPTAKGMDLSRSRARRAQSQPLPRERTRSVCRRGPTPPSPLPGSSSPAPGHHRLNRSPSPHFRGPQTWPSPGVTSLQRSGTRAGAHVTILRQMALEKRACSSYVISSNFPLPALFSLPTHYDPRPLSLAPISLIPGLHFPNFPIQRK